MSQDKPTQPAPTPETTSVPPSPTGPSQTNATPIRSDAEWDKWVQDYTNVNAARNIIKANNEYEKVTQLDKNRIEETRENVEGPVATTRSYHLNAQYMKVIFETQENIGKSELKNRQQELSKLTASGKDEKNPDVVKLNNEIQGLETAVTNLQKEAKAYDDLLVQYGNDLKNQGAEPLTAKLLNPATAQPAQSATPVTPQNSEPTVAKPLPPIPAVATPTASATETPQNSGPTVAKPLPPTPTAIPQPVASAPTTAPQTVAPQAAVTAPKATTSAPSATPAPTTPQMGKHRARAASVQNPQPTNPETKEKLTAEAKQGDRKITPSQPLDPAARSIVKSNNKDGSLGSVLRASARGAMFPMYNQMSDAHKKNYDQLPLGKRILVAFLYNPNIPGGMTLAKNHFLKAHPQPSSQLDINAANKDERMKAMREHMTANGFKTVGTPTGSPATYTFKPDKESAAYKANPDMFKGVELKISPDKVSCNKDDPKNVAAFLKAADAFNKATVKNGGEPVTVSAIDEKSDKKIRSHISESKNEDYAKLLKTPEQIKEERDAKKAQQQQPPAPRSSPAPAA